ncbi:ABC transporter permease [Paenibacillus sp. GCM10027627]|uniref:ABC transporter permease n=1 Tax=unclassified Paenibacillus TaxID=185978 RepID=UPI00363FD592
MLSIFTAQWQRDKRSPFLVLLFLILGVVATPLFTSNMGGTVKIAAFMDGGISAEEKERWLQRLQRVEGISFKLMEKERALTDVREGRKPLAVRFMKGGDYRIVASTPGLEATTVDKQLSTMLAEEGVIAGIAEGASDGEQFKERVYEGMEQPSLALSKLNPDRKKLTDQEMTFQLLYGFTLFTVMFTIGFKVSAVLEERVSGVWNRVILSPVSKTRMYMGHLIYSLFIGFVQIVCALLVLHFLLGYDLGDRFDLLFAVVALYCATTVAMSMLFAGLVKTPEQFKALIPGLFPLMPLLGGIYFPPGMVTNKFILLAGELLPITHAVDALKQITLYGVDWAELSLPLAKLLIICVLCMGIGINLVERRR